jgi:UDPglucose 6-dehydrogenase
LCANLIWMSVESAEMTKHAINAFLATSVAFINEIAGLCELAGADAGEVERGLKSDQRIGPRAYLKAGPAFFGGTLARDIAYLTGMGRQYALPCPLFNGVDESNTRHKEWPRRRLRELLGDLTGKRIAVLGLTYKPGTDTLRRSEAVELCRWLHEQGARAAAYDPAVRALPEDLKGVLTLCGSAAEAAQGAHGLYLATPWPEFADLDGSALARAMAQPVMLDPARVLKRPPQGAGTRYVTVGSPA